MFEEYDKKALKPLPSEAFRQYSYVVKTVPNNYHIEYDDHYYSVPYTYYKQEITLKASFFDIIICDSMNHKICTHKRLFKPFPKYSTNSDHMPSHHQYYFSREMETGEYRQKLGLAYLLSPRNCPHPP